MLLRDHPVLNVLRRLRGWRIGDKRVMVEAKDGSAHFFRVFECRGTIAQARDAVICEALAAEGAELVEVAQERPAVVPMPRSVQIVALSERIPFSDFAPAPLVPSRQEVDPN